MPGAVKDDRYIPTDTQTDVTDIFIIETKKHGIPLNYGKP